MIPCLSLALALVLQPAPKALGRPDRVINHEFTQIRGVVELSDGRVLVADRLAEVLGVADFAKGTLTQIGRTGGGPAEYRLPAGLIRLAGDSALLLDEGNDRIAVIGADQRIHRTYRPMAPTLSERLSPRTIDGQGRYYASIPDWVLYGMGRPTDSLPIVRWTLGTTRLDYLAWLHPAPDPPRPPRRDRPRIPILVFAPGDVWTADPSGRIAIVRAADYRVEWIDSAGRRTVGPPTSWTKLPVTREDRLAYTRRFLANSGIGGKATPDRPPGGLVATPADLMTDEKVAELADNTAFAAVRPPFTDTSPKIAPDGRLWVERSVRLDANQTWDVFDVRGQLVGQVVLPSGRRLVALGRTSAYLAAVSPDGIEQLERYSL